MVHCGTLKVYEISIFKVNFSGQISTESFWKWFSHLNIKLGEQLSLTTFYNCIIFEGLYFLKMCLNFVSSAANEYG